MLLFSLQSWIHTRGGGGGRGEGHSLIWPMRVSAAKQGMVFKVLRLKQGIQFKRLEQGVVLN